MGHARWKVKLPQPIYLLWTPISIGMRLSVGPSFLASMMIRLVAKLYVFFESY